MQLVEENSLPYVRDRKREERKMGGGCLHCPFSGVHCRGYRQHMRVLGHLVLRPTLDLDDLVLRKLQAAHQREPQIETQPRLQGEDTYKVCSVWTGIHLSKSAKISRRRKNPFSSRKDLCENQKKTFCTESSPQATYFAIGLTAALHATSFEVAHDQLEHVVRDLRRDHPAGRVDGGVHGGAVLEHGDGVVAHREVEERHERARTARVDAFDVCR